MSQIQKNPEKIIATLMNPQDGVIVNKYRKPHSVILKFAYFKKLMEKLEDLEDSLRFEKAYIRSLGEKSITLAELKAENSLK